MRWKKGNGEMENKDFVGYALGFVPGALTEEQIKKCKKAILNARKQHDAKIKKAKIKKAKAKRNNKQKGKRR
jgi:hypothetical protein